MNTYKKIITSFELAVNIACEVINQKQLKPPVRFYWRRPYFAIVISTSNYVTIITRHRHSVLRGTWVKRIFYPAELARRRRVQATTRATKSATRSRTAPMTQRTRPSPRPAVTTRMCPCDEPWRWRRPRDVSRTRPGLSHRIRHTHRYGLLFV